MVCPLLKEGMNLCNDFCGTYERLRKHLDPLLKEHELNFDFSLLFASFGLPDLAQLKITTDVPRFQEMYNYLREGSERDPEYGYAEQVMKLSYYRFPYNMEDPETMHYRGLQVRKFFKDYFLTRSLKPDDKVVIVSHSSLIGSMTARSWDGKDLVGGEHLGNCQFLPLENFRSLIIY